MNILILSYEYPPYIGGAGIYARDLAVGITQSGHNASIISCYHKSIHDCNQLDEALEKKYGIINYRIKAIKALFFIQFYFKFIQIWRNNKFDYIVFSDNRAKKMAALFGILIPNRIIKASVSVFHGGEVEYYNNGSLLFRVLQLNKCLKKLFLKQKGVIVVSESQKEIIEKAYSFLKNKIHTITHGVDHELFVQSNELDVDLVRKQLDIPKHYKVILSASRITEFKGQDVLLKSISNIKEKLTNYKVIIAGEGNYLEQLKKIAANYGIKEHIIFLGGLKREKLISLYSLADVFALPSRYEEAFGLVYLEANACKCPVISGNRGGVINAVDDGVSGFICNSTDDVEISAKIQLLLSDDHLRDTMSENAYQRFMKSFTASRMASQLIKVFENSVS